MNRRILFVAMQGSIHTVRWMSMIADLGWDLHLFPVNHGPALEGLKNVTIHRPFFRVRPRLWLRAFRREGWKALRNLVTLEDEILGSSVRVRPVSGIPIVEPMERYLGRLWRVRLGESEMRAPGPYGPGMLARLVRQLEPSLVHSLEFQHAGYLTLRAKELSGGEFPPWLATNWGSDVYFFKRFQDHRDQISRLLKSIDFYSCECERDVGEARELGFSGPVLPVFPNTGGFDLEKVAACRALLPTSERRLIVVKGYQHFAGRALMALEALERCADALRAYEVVVYLAGDEVAARARRLDREGVLNIWVAEYLTHDQMLRLYSRARVYLGVSLSDAISTSLLEAMAMGAFPIQTNTSCCEEWIEDGVGGFVVPPGNVDQIADRVRRAVTDDDLVDRAAASNWATVRERLDAEILTAKTRALYDEVFQRIDAGGGKPG